MSDPIEIELDDAAEDVARALKALMRAVKEKDPNAPYEYDPEREAQERLAEALAAYGAAVAREARK